MKVYLSNPYGTIPGEDWRDYRFFLLAKSLAEEGYDVVWFTSTFSHHFKYQRSRFSKIINVSSKLKIHLIKSSSYKYNFSLARLYRDLTYGLRLFRVLEKEYSTPDLFINGDSPLLFYFPGYYYCKQNRIPYIIDQMDLWPELIVEAVKPKYRKFLKIILYFHYMFRKRVYNNCAGFMSLAKKYYQIPLSICPALYDKPSVVIYNGIDTLKFRQIDLINEYEFEKYLPQKNNSDIWFVFAGTLGPSYDIETMLLAFQSLKYKNGSKLFIAGDGSEKYKVLDFINSNPGACIIYVGKLPEMHLRKLYSMCDVGINAYGIYSNVEMPDKFYDYTAAGLGIINSLKGEVFELINTYNIGVNYISSDCDSLRYAFANIIANPLQLKEYKLNSLKISNHYDQNSQLFLFKQFIKKLILSLGLTEKA